MQQYYEIVTSQGTMRGFFHKPKANTFPVCIIFHGFTGQKTGTKFAYVQIARMLEAQGIGTIRMDFLGSGESDLSFRDMTFAQELSCAGTILEEVLRMPEAKEVYVLGHSMGGAIASELVKQYPNDITRLCLWAPAYNLPEALGYLVGKVKANAEGIYDYHGYEISQAFVDDLVTRDLYQNLDTYKNKLLVIHGTEDTTVPYAISDTYRKAFSNNYIFEKIETGTHNFDSLEHIQKVIAVSLAFLSK